MFTVALGTSVFWPEVAYQFWILMIHYLQELYEHKVESWKVQLWRTEFRCTNYSNSFLALQIANREKKSKGDATPAASAAAAADGDNEYKPIVVEAYNRMSKVLAATYVTLRLFAHVYELMMSM